MHTADQIIREMSDRRRAGPDTLWWPDKSDVLRWASSDPADVRALYEEIAALVARGYDGGALSFDLCDGIVNGLYAAFMELRLTEMPPLYYEVFLAFDDGEYRRPADGEGVDPVKTYTDTRIRQIVETLLS